MKVILIILFALIGANAFSQQIDSKKPHPQFNKINRHLLKDSSYIGLFRYEGSDNVFNYGVYKVKGKYIKVRVLNSEIPAPIQPFWIVNDSTIVDTTLATLQLRKIKPWD